MFPPRRSAPESVVPATSMAGSPLGSGLPSVLIGEQDLPLINLVIVLGVVGVALGLINRFIPMASSIKSILNVVVVVVVAIWVLQAVGLWAGVSSFRVGR